MQEDDPISEEPIVLEGVDVAELQELAEQGHAAAQTKLGAMYANGAGVTADDAEAVRWFRLAADQGDAAAQNSLGVMYAVGAGVTEDDEEAVRWFRLAADQGVAIAQTNLGAVYANGEGVVQDYVRAHMWFNLAAAQGTAIAQTERDRLENAMTSQQIALAQEMTTRCLESNYSDCD